ncbi:MAG: amino acid racemase [Tatlockia sp.]|nr:amino acid racemase [Tatlockia sp.]
MATSTLPTIGIVGVTIPGAIDCINKINQKFHNYFTSHNHPNIILHQLNFGPTHQAQIQGQWDIVENRLIASTTQLTKAGADFIIIPANTVHKVINNIIKRTAIPVLSILDSVAAECKRLQLKKVGILGTCWTMAERLYQQTLELNGIVEIIPSPEEQKIVQKAIFAELIPKGEVQSTTLASLLSIVESLKIRGCDAIILACTELPLVLNCENCQITTVDTSAILAESAVQYARALITTLDYNLTN